MVVRLGSVAVCRCESESSVVTAAKGKVLRASVKLREELKGQQLVAMGSEL